MSYSFSDLKPDFRLVSVQILLENVALSETVHNGSEFVPHGAFRPKTCVTCCVRGLRATRTLHVGHYIYTSSPALHVQNRKHYITRTPVYSVYMYIC